MLFRELMRYIYLFTRRCIGWLRQNQKGEYKTHSRYDSMQQHSNNNFSKRLVFQKTDFLTWFPLIQWPRLIFQRAQLAGCLSFVFLCSYLLEELDILFRKMLMPPCCTVNMPDYKAQLPPFQWWEKVLSLLSVQIMSHKTHVCNAIYTTYHYIIKYKIIKAEIILASCSTTITQTGHPWPTTPNYLSYSRLTFKVSQNIPKGSKQQQIKWPLLLQLKNP